MDLVICHQANPSVVSSQIGEQLSLKGFRGGKDDGDITFLHTYNLRGFYIIWIYLNLGNLFLCKCIYRRLAQPTVCFMIMVLVNPRFVLTLYILWCNFAGHCHGTYAHSGTSFNLVQHQGSQWTHNEGNVATTLWFDLHHRNN